MIFQSAAVLALATATLVSSTSALPSAPPVRVVTIAGPRTASQAGLHNRADGSFDKQFAHNAVRGIVARYERRAREAKLRKRTVMEKSCKKPSVAVPLTNAIYEGEPDLLYYGDITMGSNKQPISVVFDTGSSDLVVPISCVGSCPGGWFNTSASSTYNSTGTPFDGAYGSGTASGVLASDCVQVGGIGSLPTYFGAINNSTGSFSTGPNVGIMGLAFEAMAKTGRPTFMDNLISSNQLTKNLFSVFLSRNGTAGSQLTLGGINPAHYTGVITTIPVVSETYWEVMVMGLDLGGINVAGSEMHTSIDTGTSQLYFPSIVVERLYAAIPGASVNADMTAGGAGTYYQFPCNETEHVGLRFASAPTKVFNIDPADFNLGAVDDTGDYCIGGIIGVDLWLEGRSMSIVGDLWLKSWLSIYTHNGASATVGFAASKA